jgi:hypothetical protein
LVISAHKSVAELGVIGRAEDMHAIMDAERVATLAYLDEVTRRRGGRRGRAATATQTGGLIYAHTRHATSRAGDPCPHDHVLVANVLEMLDTQGGWKAADTALWREHVHAATMVGRHAAARRAVDLRYRIEADTGPSGRLRHWRVAGVPDEVVALHSKRQRRSTRPLRCAAMAPIGPGRWRPGPRAASRDTNRSRTWWPGGGRSWLRPAGPSNDSPRPSIRRPAGQPASPLSVRFVRKVLAEVLGGDGELAKRKVFARRHLVVELAPYFYGHEPRVLEAVVDRALADPEVVPLVGVAGARDRMYSLASVLARESAIADSLGRQVDRSDAPAVDSATVEAAVASAEARIRGPLSDGQR